MSTTVSNPYSFNIVNNTGFTSPTITALPDKTTLLETLMDETKTITIPLGCKVVELLCTATGEGFGNDAEITVQNVYNNKYWCDIIGDIYDVSGIICVGVTPGKTYKLRVFGIDSVDATCKIYYSKNINNKTPTVTDY